MATKALSNRYTGELFFSYLNEQEQDRCKRLNKVSCKLLDAIQRRKLFSDIPDDFTQAFGRECLERVRVFNSLNYRGISSFHSHRFYERNIHLWRDDSFLLGKGDTFRINQNNLAGKTCLWFKVDCHAEGNCRGSLVVKRAVGVVCFNGKKEWTVHFEGLGDGDPEHALSQLSKMSAATLFDFFRGEQLEHRRRVAIHLAPPLAPLVVRSFEEDYARVTDSCFCLFSCFRDLFFSSGCSSCDLAKDGRYTLRLG